MPARSQKPRSLTQPRRSGRETTRERVEIGLFAAGVGAEPRFVPLAHFSSRNAHNVPARRSSPFSYFRSMPAKYPAGPLVKCPAGRVVTSASATAAYSWPISSQARAQSVRLILSSPDSQ
jgi:hypothetical protein